MSDMKRHLPAETSISLPATTVAYLIQTQAFPSAATTVPIQGNCINIGQM